MVYTFAWMVIFVSLGETLKKSLIWIITKICLYG
ncbi:hypothetical protein BL05077 [Bacillus licheniformis DSM 13 = ATCC 14580]|uniref:Uncharacterized protein n=1 Tax=Bacillus licheniformis (strain ATCC 14580 / DSM 13 / JCM 2505 / CCUG 7422 / NBRC 12200 / NCIMB 9375 / NCTC 10341 / NRRL NRS-1264 / Gibson 46) TaxID=279010 RepID=Q62XL7_BACLD|nr:hypothetical protein BL05077 [Bacillus licheniformis DSM 13 = ATCC 14580]